jgi:hypothetical protein
MQRSLSLEKQGPKDYCFNQYVQSSERRQNNDIATVSSTPGSVSTTSNTMSIEDRKLNMCGRGAY